MKRISVLLALLFVLSACGTLTGDVLTFKSADPALSVAFRLLPAPDPTLCELVIKGNLAADGTRIAHSPGQRNYESTIIDESKGEKWFCDLDAAIAEGWRAAKN